MFKPRIIQPPVALYYFKKNSIIRNHHFLAVVIAALSFCSCQKENLSNTVLNSTTSSAASFNADASAIQLMPGKMVNYGALITPPPDQDYVKFQFNVAGQLGISCLRVRALVPCDHPNPVVNNPNNQYNIVLNFNKADFHGTLMPFATDLDQYQEDLTKTLSLYKTMPVVAVIENEESNRFYYSGTAQQYIDQLKVAIDVMHARGIKVANGGITSQGLNYLVYQDFLNQGKTDSAAWFKALTNVTPNASSTQERGNFVNTLLQAYTGMSLDYVNFHWKGTSPNTDALSSVINYLKKRTLKPVISNEIGQLDSDPNTLLSHIQLCTDKNMPYVLWFSPNMTSGLRGTSLQYPDGTLTSSGIAYKNYLAN